VQGPSCDGGRYTSLALPRGLRHHSGAPSPAYAQILNIVQACPPTHTYQRWPTDARPCLLALDPASQTDFHTSRTSRSDINEHCFHFAGYGRPCFATTYCIAAIFAHPRHSIPRHPRQQTAAPGTHLKMSFRGFSKSVARVSHHDVCEAGILGDHENSGRRSF
jgi:hypothetical protein